MQVRLPLGTFKRFGDLTGRLAGFEPVREGSTPSPRTSGHREVSEIQARVEGTKLIQCRPALLAAQKCVGWAWASPCGRNPHALELCRFNSCPTHLGGHRFDYCHGSVQQARASGRATRLQIWCQWGSNPHGPADGSECSLTIDRKLHRCGPRVGTPPLTGPM